MFGKLFGRKSGDAPQAAAQPSELHHEAAAQLSRWLMQCANSERGVHVETMTAMLGSLAGMACQIAARHALLDGPRDWGTPWAVAAGADGASYFFGDAINHFLLEDRLSFWSLAAGAVAALGEEVPDVIPVVRHVSATVGSEAFGRIRYPEGTSADGAPADYVRHLFPDVQENFTRLGLDPTEWPVAFGLAAQEFLRMAKAVVAPPAALLVLMECAIVMAKVDPAPLGLSAPTPGA